MQMVEVTAAIEATGGDGGRGDNDDGYGVISAYLEPRRDFLSYCEKINLLCAHLD